MSTNTPPRANATACRHQYQLQPSHHELPTRLEPLLDENPHTDPRYRPEPHLPQAQDALRRHRRSSSRRRWSRRRSVRSVTRALQGATGSKARERQSHSCDGECEGEGEAVAGEEGGGAGRGGWRGGAEEAGGGKGAGGERAGVGVPEEVGERRWPAERRHCGVIVVRVGDRLELRGCGCAAQTQ